MNIENQVVSIELAKRLKELGIKQESYFKFELRDNGDFCIYHSKPVSCAYKYFSAFTSAELGNILPSDFRRWNDEDRLYHDHFFHEIKVNDEYIIEYLINDDPSRSQGFKDNNEANARAKMLIYLIENKLMEIPK
jgi:hypothetical protein